MFKEKQANGGIQISKLNISGHSFVWLVLGICTYHFLSNIELAVDLALWDEAFYLSSAHSFSQTFRFPGANWAPLYTLWYYVLSLFNPTPTFLYYLNTALVTSLFPFAAVWAAIRFKVPPLLALLVGLVLLLGYLNLEISPKPAHLALAVLLFTIGLTTYFSSVLYQLVVLSLGTLLSSFLRPELFLSFLLISLIFLGHFLLNFKQLQKGQWLILAGWGSSMLLLFYCFGIPLLTQDDRSMMAFGQHFALRWTGWTQSNLNPQLNWQLILKNNFGNAHSYLDLISNNPSLLVKHLMANCLDFVKNIRFVFYHYPFFVDPSKMAINGLITMGIFGGFVIYRFKAMISSFKELSLTSICVLIFMVPGLLSCILIYPRMHYLLIVSVLGLVWILVLASRNWEITGCVPTFLLPLTLLYWTPNAAKTIQPLMKNKNSVEFIQSYQPLQVRMLESGAGLGFYFQNIARFTMTDFPKSPAPSEYLVENKINTVFVDYYFDKQPSYSFQPLWKTWLESGYKKDGFFKYSINGNYVFLKTKP